MFTLIATILGALTSALPQLIELFDRKNRLQHERDLLQLRMDAAAQGIELQIDLENARADIREGDSLREHDMALRGNSFIETLRAETAGKKVLAVASVDLAHVGPNFGDDFFMDTARRETLAKSDANLMEAIAHGDANRFFEEVAAVEDQNRICGFSSIYLMLRYLGAVKGQSIAYDHCPADQKDTSLVSICGMLLD